MDFFIQVTKAFEQPSIAIVGARKVDYQCACETQELAKSLADEGIVIVSGGAIGCDGAAIEGR